MIQSRTHIKASICLCSKSSEDWDEDIIGHLEVQGYDISYCNPADSVDNRFLLDPPDMVLVADMESAASLEQTITDVNIVCVLISDDVNHYLPENIIDFVFPSSAVQIDRQIQSLLRMRQETQQYKERAQQYESEVTELRDELEQLKRTNSEVEVLKNAIVKNVSHELKTPLLQVKAAVALLAEDVKNEELSNYAKGATGRLETLVKNITLLGSSLDKNLSPVIARDAVEYARRNIRRVWEHKDSTDRIHVEIEDNLPPVLADKLGLSTVLQLLMDNALKFSQGNVYVSIKKAGDKVRIAVNDTGIGIAQKDVNAIFDTFYQIDSSSTRRYGGMGVGLAIVRLILDNHDTQIRVESQVGKGSTFSFELPIVDMH